MHPLGWLAKYFLLSLVAAITADKAIDTVPIADKIGEPWRGLFFRGSRDDSGRNGDDS